MKKRLFTLIATILVLSLSGCKHTKEPSKPDISTSESHVEAQTECPNEVNPTEDTVNPEYRAQNYTGQPYIEINDNIPFFTEEDIYTESFEVYSDLDDFGRCGTAFACLGTDIMPTVDRGAIGHIKPSGWQTSNYNQYPGLVDGNYLYNRCHLIAYMLAGENDNEKNLITGTRYLNVTGMLPFEDMVHDYLIEHQTNHVMYRVTPVFNGNNLLAEGVLMEAYSVEDNGQLQFCVFCYNVQPYVVIDYATGANNISPDYTGTTPTEADWEDNSEWYSYVLNENSRKIHLPSCSAVGDMNENNRTYTNRSYDELIAEGYTPCGLCHPN